MKFTVTIPNLSKADADKAYTTLEKMQADDAVGLLRKPVEKMRKADAQGVEVPGGELHRESG